MRLPVIRLVIITFILVVFRATGGIYGKRSGAGPFLRRTFPGYWYYRSLGRRHLKSMPQAKAFLLKHFYFAGLLSPSELDDFTYRTLTVRKSKLFIDHDGVAPEEEQCLLLSASIAQLTFGLGPSYWLPGYTHIRVHPDIFYSRLVGAHVKGLTLGRSIVHISWRHYIEGISDPISGICLGLHEFAHAMVLDHSTPVEEGDLYLWKKIATTFLQNKEVTSPIIRDYGLSNENELWAVCCELFFERPAELKQHHPNIYSATARLLNQDMAKRIAHSRKAA